MFSRNILLGSVFCLTDNRQCGRRSIPYIHIPYTFSHLLWDEAITAVHCTAYYCVALYCTAHRAHYTACRWTAMHNKCSELHWLPLLDITMALFGTTQLCGRVARHDICQKWNPSRSEGPTLPRSWGGLFRPCGVRNYGLWPDQTVFGQAGGIRSILPSRGPDPLCCTKCPRWYSWLNNCLYPQPIYVPCYLMFQVVF